jgi:hypothetical protein
MPRRIIPGTQTVVDGERQFQPDHHARTKT